MVIEYFSKSLSYLIIWDMLPIASLISEVTKMHLVDSIYFAFKIQEEKNTYLELSVFMFS